MQAQCSLGIAVLYWLVYYYRSRPYTIERMSSFTLLRFKWAAFLVMITKLTLKSWKVKSNIPTPRSLLVHPSINNYVKDHQDDDVFKACCVNLMTFPYLVTSNSRSYSQTSCSSSKYGMCVVWFNTLGKDVKLMEDINDLMGSVSWALEPFFLSSFPKDCISLQYTRDDSCFSIVPRSVIWILSTHMSMHWTLSTGWLQNRSFKRLEY